MTLIKKIADTTLIQRVLCLLLSLLFLFSAVAAVTMAWSDMTQHRTNSFEGKTVTPLDVILQKLEKDANGNETENIVRNAEFYLFMIDGKDEVQINERFVTDENGRIVLPNLKPGSYYFLETNPGYSHDYDKDENGNTINKYPFTVGSFSPEGEILTVKAYNRLKSADLIISKTVQNADGSALNDVQLDREFEFTVTFTDGGTYKYKIGNGAEQELKSGGKLKLKHNQQAVFTNLPVGIGYRVVETPVFGYDITSKNHQGNITADGAKAEFINTTGSRTGTLSISKKVTGDNADTNKEFEFVITFSDDGTYAYTINNGLQQSFTSGGTIKLKHQDVLRFVNLPEGLRYTVTEKDYSQDGYTAGVQEYNGIMIQGHVELPFINHKESGGKNGSLVISKQVLGAADNKEFAFTLTFSDNGTYQYRLNGDGELQNFTSGSKIILKHNEYVLFENLPVGLHYQIVEDDYTGDGYVASITDAHGTIAEGNVAGVIFKNQKQDEAKLIVKKIVEGDIPEKDKNKTFNFTVIINGKETKFTLKHGEEKSFTLPLGAIYEVLEDDYFAEGYIQSTITNGYGTAGQEVVEIIRTNKYVGPVETEIKGEKTWDLSKNPQAEKPDTITVYLKDGNRVVASATVRPDENGKWTYTFKAPKYAADGKTEIKYTVDEADVTGYTKEINGYNIKNTADKPVDPVTPAVLEAPGVKKTITGDTPKKSDAFTFKLQALNDAPMPQGSVNGEKYITINGQGQNTFGSITYYKAGTYKYTITETEGVISGYTYDASIYNLTVTVTESNKKLTIQSAVYSKLNDSKPHSIAEFTNKYEKPEEPTTPNDKITINGQKTWYHGSNKDIPEYIQIQLYADGAVIYDVKVTAESHWRWTFSLPKYNKNGEEITYTIDEIPLDGYKKVINGYNISNIHSSFPYDPEDPDFPWDPNDPNNPDNPSGGSSTGGYINPQTGDASNIWIWVVGMVISAFLLRYVLFHETDTLQKRKEEQS